MARLIKQKQLIGSPIKVARLIDIDGPLRFLWVIRFWQSMKAPQKFQLPLQGFCYVGDRFVPDRSIHKAVFEFAVGARAAILGGTTTEIVSNAKIINCWTTIYPSPDLIEIMMKKEENFHIQTAGGVIGVEG